MPEQVGEEFEAARAREAAMVQHVKLAVEADPVLATTVQTAYEVTLRGRSQLDGIATAIEHTVRTQEAFALDTPAGARALMSFLAVKRQEIARVVSEATADSDAKAALLPSLDPHYAVTPPRDRAQLAGFDTFKDSPRVPIPERPWEYNLDFTSDVEARSGDWPGVRNAGEVTSVNDVWNELNRCFHCNFPMGGAPATLPKAGDQLPLEIKVAGQQMPAHFPVKVTQVEKTANNIDIEFATLPGHVDGVGSTIHFHFYEQCGQLHLGIRGYIENGPGSQEGPLAALGPVLRAGYTEVAKAVWQPYIDRVTRHVADAKGLLTFGGQ